MHRLGAFLFGPWMLVCYAVCSVGLGAVLALAVDPLDPIPDNAVTSVEPGRAAIVTLAVMTGADPSSMANELDSSTYVRVWAWALHVFGWILIPAVIGYFVADKVAGAKSAIARAETGEAVEELADAAGLGLSQAQMRRALDDIHLRIEEMRSGIDRGGE
jgi:hypothetical protein